MYLYYYSYTKLHISHTCTIFTLHSHYMHICKYRLHIRTDNYTHKHYMRELLHKIYLAVAILCSSVFSRKFCLSLCSRWSRVAHYKYEIAL